MWGFIITWQSAKILKTAKRQKGSHLQLRTVKEGVEEIEANNKGGRYFLY